MIDALDECGPDSKKNKLLRCICKHFLKLPKWIAFFVTTRPETKIVSELKKFEPFEFKADSKYNMDDIQIVLRAMLARKIHGGNTALLDDCVAFLAEKSKGLFIYVKYVLERLGTMPDESITMVEDVNHFPDGIDGWSQNVDSSIPRY